MVTPNAAKGIALSVLSLGILGLMPVISNSRPPTFDALGFAFWLSVWQSAFALPVAAWELWSGERGLLAAPARQQRRTLLVALVTGIVFGLSTLLYVYGVEKAGTVSGAIAIQAYPVFAILLETVFLGRRKTLVELGLTGVLIGALYFLATGGTWRIEGASLWFLVVLGVPLLWSIAHVVIKEELGRTPITPAQVTLLRVVVSALFLGLLVMTIGAPETREHDLSMTFQTHALLMGFVYYLELIVWFYAVRHIDVSLASSIATPWPAVTMVLAVIFLGDTIQLYQVVALAVIVASIYGLMLAELRKARVAADA